jgi:uncharacterized membrane protein
MSETNPNSRLEAFCDAVFAIALTLLIIDIKIPSSEHIDSSAALWLALWKLKSSIFAFILSFTIILITWVNHHNALKLSNKSTTSFIYANGFLLLTVVFLPFPTSLMGEYLLTSHASPAVILYDSLLALQAIGWILICLAAIKNKLGKSEKAMLEIRANLKYGFYALILYSLFAIVAIWFPLAIAIITTISWIFWLIWGISIRQEEMN